MIPDPSMKLDGTTQADGDPSRSIEERLHKLETSLRSRTIEERLQNLEYQAEESNEASSDGEELPPEGEGEKALRLALANFLNSGAASQAIKEIFIAVGDLIKQQSERRTKEAEAQRRLAWKFNYVGLGFSGFVFIALCVLLWHDRIPKELAAALIGSLFGYWYGQRKDR